MSFAFIVISYSDDLPLLLEFPAKQLLSNPGCMKTELKTGCNKKTVDLCFLHVIRTVSSSTNPSIGIIFRCSKILPDTTNIILKLEDVASTGHSGQDTTLGTKSNRNTHKIR